MILVNLDIVAVLRYGSNTTMNVTAIRNSKPLFLNLKILKVKNFLIFVRVPHMLVDGSDRKMDAKFVISDPKTIG